MHTVTLKADDDFFDLLGTLSKELKTSKSELIRHAVMDYRKQLERQKLKDQVKKASLYVRENSQEIVDEFDALSGEGIE